jgi:hypothetical protein
MPFPAPSPTPAAVADALVEALAPGNGLSDALGEVDALADELDVVDGLTEALADGDALALDDGLTETVGTGAGGLAAPAPNRWPSSEAMAATMPMTAAKIRRHRMNMSMIDSPVID